MKYKKIVLIVLLSFQSTQVMALSKKEVKLYTALMSAVGGFFTLAALQVPSGDYFHYFKPNIKLGFIAGIYSAGMIALAYQGMNEQTPEFRLKESFNKLKKIIDDIEKTLQNPFFHELKNQECSRDFILKHFLYSKYPFVECSNYLNTFRDKILSVRSVLDFMHDMYKEATDKKECDRCMNFNVPFDEKELLETIDTYLFYIKSSGFYLKELEISQAEEDVEKQIDAYKKEQKKMRHRPPFILPIFCPASL